MTPIMKRTEKDDAVSPVVGVMLMLVVTIIIAAVVAAFASGVATQTDKVPSAMLDASVDADWDAGTYSTGNGALFITSVGGELIDLSKISVKISSKSGASYTYEGPVHGNYEKQSHLKPGETLNLVYGQSKNTSGDPDNPVYTCLSVDLGTAVSAGNVYEVIVVYNGKNIMLDKEVIAA